MKRGVTNFTMAHKYEQKLDCCVGVAITKDGQDFLLNWCVMNFPGNTTPSWKRGSRRALRSVR
jgi:hypothetical protein